AECRFVARDGRIVWVLGEARVVRDEAGRPLFMQGIAFDISTMKNAEVHLRQKLDEYTVFVSHELKKPLARLISEMKEEPMILTKGRKQAAVCEMADWVLGQAQDMWNMIEAMLRWARVEDRQAKRLIPHDCLAVFE